MLEKTFQDNGLQTVVGKSTQIFNMDETGFLQDPAPLLVHVVAPVGSKKNSSQIHVQHQETRPRSLLQCCRLCYVCMPPTVNFDRKSLRQEFTTGYVPGTCMRYQVVGG